MTLIELCAGSAAVSCRALGATHAPARYMGGKARMANRILQLLEIHEPPDRVILVDPGPWGSVWRWLPHHRDAVVTRLRDYIRDHDPLQLYERIKNAPTPAAPIRYTTDFLVLQTLNWRSKPVGDRDGRWVTHGVSETMAHGGEATGSFGAIRPQLPALVDRLMALEGLDRIRSCRNSAMRFAPNFLDFVPPFINDDDDVVVYIDPPYADTEGYQHHLDRSQVLELVDRWRPRARVAVSEATPLHELDRAVEVGAQGKSAKLGPPDAPPRGEWLSMTYEPRQTELWA